MTNLTIFDLDNTLLGGDSDHAWGEFLSGQGIVDPDEHSDALHHEFMETKIKPLRLEKADALIEKHQQAGDVLLIITATNHFIASPIAEALGINNILATDPEIIDGVISGKILGTPCFQEGKITRLNEWLDAQKFTPHSVSFYSDSINDRPLLEFADNPVVVDPDSKLKEHALMVGWPIISLR